jgi:radical SAM protein (TIGR01212 family)
MYKTFSQYLKTKYGTAVRKICIDGGFSCPNRDGTAGHGGCIFCGERGAGEHIDATLSIREQVSSGLASGKADAYIAYFQNFTNTYAPVEILRERYLSALTDKRIVALAIGTRPDCITPDICDLLGELQSKVDIWVELGLQTANDDTASVINRGYPLSVYESAAALLCERKIPFVTHMIIGLPGEGEKEALETAKVILDSGAWGIKIHSLYVMEGTRLAELYRKKAYTPPTFEEYTDTAAKVLALIGDRLVVHRITGDCPGDLLVAPEWSREKSRVIDAIRKKLTLLESDA